MAPAVLVRRARLEAGFSQSELAALAGTSQPAIARYEGGHVEPDLSTLSRLLTACGFQLRLTVDRLDPGDVRRLRSSVRRDPVERVEANRRATRLASASVAAIAQGRVRKLSGA